MMKKLSMLLALALLATCCVFALAACGGNETENSSSVVSAESTASEASSAAPSQAASSETSTPDDESSAVEDSSEPESAPTSVEGVVGMDAPEGKTNLALNKTYTGADPTDYTGVSQYSAALTDGAALGELKYDNNWFAFWYNPNGENNPLDHTNAPDGVGDMVIDLGEAADVSMVRVHALMGNISGIKSPKSITVALSADGENFEEYGTISFVAPEDTLADVNWVGFQADGTVNARYVRITVELNGIFAFLNEVEVY